ncbi:MAG TPA: V-type ATP synthase subunit D [Clostridiales bacterium]|nr:V-type ATP synthase subunit D [Clostridiales bacterium]
MALIRVNPTRMELANLKKKLRTSQKGHKLLKDKRDDLMKKFLALVRENQELRKIVEEKIMGVYEGFVIAGAVMSPEALDEALMMPKQRVELEVGSQNMMSVVVPVFSFETSGGEGDNYSYGFVSTSGELDSSVAALADVLPYMLKLAQMEKSAQLLAEEIEKTRRTVNALEYVRIPNLQETIRYIRMKLEENDRGNTTRLMKVKDMIVQQAIEEQKARDGMAG